MKKKRSNELIKRNEGLRLKAYKDTVGVWTIGYGNTYYPLEFRIKGKVKDGDIITKEEADYILERLLKEDFDVS